MKLIIKYFGQLRQITGVEQEEFELPKGGTLKDVILQQASLHGEDFRRVAFDDRQNLRPSVIILVNGNAIDKDKPPQLADGNEITILPAIAGG